MTLAECVRIAARSIEEALIIPECQSLAHNDPLEFGLVTAGASPWLAGLFFALTSILVAFAISSTIRNRIIPEPEDPRYADLCGFRYLEDDGMTFQCNKKRICRVWQLTGMDHQGLAAEARNDAARTRSNLLNQLARTEQTPVIKFFTLRRKTAYFAGAEEQVPIHNREFPAPEIIRNRWARSFQDNPIYENSHYVIIEYPDSIKGRRDMKTATTSMESFAEYKPALLSCDPDSPESPLSPLAKVLSPCSMGSPAAAKDSEISDLICTDQVSYLGKGTFQFSSAAGEKFMSVISIRYLPDSITEAPILALAKISAECTLLHTVQPLKSTQAASSLTIKKRRISGMEGSEEIQGKIQEVLNSLATGFADQTTFVFNYAFSVFIYGDTLEELEKAKDQVWSAMQPAGIAPANEGYAGQACWWQFQPGYPFYPRLYHFLSEQAANFIVPQSISAGIPRSDWTPKPLITFRTVTNTPYSFQFHATEDREASGHMVIIAPTGKGKTTLMSMLATHVLAIPGANVQMYDRNLGCENFVRCCGGSYVSFTDSADGMIKAALNPMQMDDVPENRAFLRRWILSLVPDYTDTDRQDVANAIDSSYEFLKREDRSLKTLYHTSFRPGSKSRQYLDQWINDPQYCEIFNAALDSTAGILGNSNVPLVGYDCTAAFNDPDLASPLIEYLMHRMREASPGQPSLAFIDETEPLLKNPNFHEAIRIGLQEGRKLRHVYVLCFQRPEAIKATGMDQLIRGQCSTIIFATNRQANPQDYADFGLTEGELDFILERKPVRSRHAMLVKRYAGSGTAVLDFDLNPLGDMMRTFASGKASVMELRRCIRDAGESAGVARYLGLSPNQ